MIEIPTITYRKCDGIPRREVLRIGSLGLFGLNLPHLLRAGEKKEVSCILLWLSGGLSQMDSFDPKPDAPAEIRGEFKNDPHQHARHPLRRAPPAARPHDFEVLAGPLHDAQSGIARPRRSAREYGLSTHAFGSRRALSVAGLDCELANRLPQWRASGAWLRPGGKRCLS